MKDWERVYSGNQLHIVEIIKAVLKDHEIELVVMDKRVSNYPGVGDIDVYVPAGDSILAKIIIEQLDL